MVTEDPAAVAARKQGEFQLAVGMAVGLGVAVLGYSFKFIREMRRTMALRNRVRLPWEVE